MSIVHVNAKVYLSHWRIQGGSSLVPPPGPNSFIFMQFSAKNLQNNITLGVGPPTRKILDPPLIMKLCLTPVADPLFGRGGCASPREDAPTLQGCANLLFFPENCMKLERKKI